MRQSRSDRTLARALEAVQDHGGATLLSYVDAGGAVRPLQSGTLNAYLAEHTGTDATAKTFRTWAGTVAAYDVARKGDATIAAMVAAAADRLHNTPAVARTSYVHPQVIALAGDAARPDPDRRAELTLPEAGLLDLLGG